MKMKVQKIDNFDNDKKSNNKAVEMMVLMQKTIEGQGYFPGK